MHVLVHLGSTPALSFAELSQSIRGLRPRLYGANWFTADLTPLPRVDRLGGTVRIAELRGDAVPESELRLALLGLLMGAGQEGRLEYGFTILDGELPLQKMGLELKTMLKQREIAARFVSGGDRQLATVLVKKRKVVEIVLAPHEGAWLVGRTVAIQDIESYVFRDTHKPARNLARGMLPPKIAQILLNLAAAPVGSITLDPYCGTGTVLLEGIVQGREVRGSDSDPAAVEEARKNLQWFGVITQEAFDPQWVVQADAAAFRADPELGAIATEGTLGRMLETAPTQAQSERVFAEIGRVHRGFFQRAAASLPAGARIAMTLPAYRTPQGTRTFPAPAFRSLLPEGLSLVPLLAAEHAQRYLPRLTDKGGIVVERPDQFVGREVILLRRA